MHKSHSKNGDMLSARLNNKAGEAIESSQYKWDGRRRRPTRRVRPTGIKVPKSHKEAGIVKTQKIIGASFFASGELFDWGLFVASVAMFLFINLITSNWTTSLQSQALVFLIWMILGTAYNLAIFSRLGEEQGLLWLDGFLLELIFSMENVFVFHIIVEAFSTPVRPVRKALFVVVCWQNLYDMVLYMGLATWLDSLILLPYLLGAWLVYVGSQAASENHEPIGDIMHTAPVAMCRAMLGSRLYLHYDHESPCAVFMSRKDGMCHMSLLGLVIVCLLLADFVLEIDVTLTKIESLQDQHISFTSSAVASFAMPALYFVARDLFDRFSFLKYGISFVLVFFGVQMLFCSVFRLSPLEGCGIIVAVMIFCVLASPTKTMPKQTCDKERGEAWGSLNYGSISQESIPYEPKSQDNLPFDEDEKLSFSPLSTAPSPPPPWRPTNVNGDD